MWEREADRGGEGAGRCVPVVGECGAPAFFVFGGREGEEGRDSSSGQEDSPRMCASVRLLACMRADMASLVLEAIERSRAEGTFVRPADERRFGARARAHRGDRLESVAIVARWIAFVGFYADWADAPRDLISRRKEASGGDPGGSVALRIQRDELRVRLGPDEALRKPLSRQASLRVRLLGRGLRERRRLLLRRRGRCWRWRRRRGWRRRLLRLLGLLGGSAEGLGELVRVHVASGALARRAPVQAVRREGRECGGPAGAGPRAERNEARRQSTPTRRARAHTHTRSATSGRATTGAAQDLMRLGTGTDSLAA